MSETVYWPYPILRFGIVACAFFPTTFLEKAVYCIARNSLEQQKQRAETGDLYGLELEVKIVKGLRQYILIHLFSFTTYPLWKFNFKTLAK